MSSYSKRDLARIDPLPLIRMYPARFIPGGKPTGPRLIGLVVRAALTAGAQTVCSGSLGGGWWYVAGSPDWVASPKQFKNIVPFPEEEPNAMRPEVLITAFAHQVVTLVQSEEGVRCMNIKGTSQSEWQGVNMHDFQRVIAFYLEL